MLITPAHVHQAIQEYLGLNGYAHDLGFGLRDTVSLPFSIPRYKREHRHEEHFYSEERD